MAKSSNLADAAHAVLRRDIVTGALSPGAHLSEGGVCARYGLTLAPVRGALVRLRAEGLLESRPRAGHAVASITVADVLDVYALRRVVQAHATEQAAGRADPAVLGRLHQACEASIGHRLPCIAANRAFHQAVTDAAGSPRLSRLVADLLDHSERMQHVAMSLRANRPLPAWRGALIAALAAPDAPAAAAIMIGHLDAMRAIALEALVVNPALRGVALQVG